jgi:hypothetical protein
MRRPAGTGKNYGNDPRTHPCISHLSIGLDPLFAVLPQKLDRPLAYFIAWSKIGKNCKSEEVLENDRRIISQRAPSKLFQELGSGNTSPPQHRDRTLRDAALAERVRELASRIRGCPKDGISRKVYRTS